MLTITKDSVYLAESDELTLTCVASKEVPEGISWFKVSKDGEDEEILENIVDSIKISKVC